MVSDTIRFEPVRRCMDQVRPYTGTDSGSELAFRTLVRVHVFMVMIGDRAAGKNRFVPVDTGFKKQQILKADFRFGTRHSKKID